MLATERTEFRLYCVEVDTHLMGWNEIGAFYFTSISFFYHFYYFFFYVCYLQF